MEQSERTKVHRGRIRIKQYRSICILVVTMLRLDPMLFDHSTRPSSVDHREYPEGISGVSVELGIPRTTELKDAAAADPETGSSPGNLLTAMHSGSSANCSSQKI
jgi:hypothetical protein